MVLGQAQVRWREHRPTHHQGASHQSGLATSLVVVLAALVTGCTSASAPTAGPAAAHVGAVLEDFKLTTSKLNVKAGRIVFDVANPGPSTHEFNVDRTDLGAEQLPLASSGLMVREDASELHRVGSIESLEIADKRTLTLDLAPGHYVLYCNLEGHYLSNMRVGLDVS